jgi:hypothetical protein
VSFTENLRETQDARTSRPRDGSSVVPRSGEIAALVWILCGANAFGDGYLTAGNGVTATTSVFPEIG